MYFKDIKLLLVRFKGLSIKDMKFDLEIDLIHHFDNVFVFIELINYKP